MDERPTSGEDPDIVRWCMKFHCGSDVWHLGGLVDRSQEVDSPSIGSVLDDGREADVVPCNQLGDVKATRF